MRIFAFCLLPFAFLLASCRPSAAPVAISNRPISINGVLQTNVPMMPPKSFEKFGWETFDNKPVKLGAMKGKVVVLDFWATNCPPRIKEIPHLKELQAKYGKEKLEVVGLHVGDDEDRGRVPEFVDKLKIDYTLGYPENELSQFIFATESAIPQTAVFDRSGKLARKFVGFNDDIKSELDKTIEQAINEKQENL